MEIATLIERFGLAIGLLIYFIWRDYKTSKEHKDDIRNIAIRTAESIEKSTEAIRDANKVAEKSTKAVSDNTHMLNNVRGVLLSKKGSSNDGGGS